LKVVDYKGIDPDHLAPRISRDTEGPVAGEGLQFVPQRGKGTKEGQLSRRLKTDITALITAIGLSFPTTKRPKAVWIKSSKPSLDSFIHWYGRTVRGCGEYEAGRALKSYATWSEWYAAGEPTGVRPKIHPLCKGRRTVRYGNEDIQVLTFPFLTGPLDLSAILKRFWSGKLTEQDQVVLSQFKRFGRGLTPGNDSCKKEAIRQFHEDVTTLHSPLRDEQRERFKEGIKKYATAYSRKFSRTVRFVHTSISSSGSLLTTRKQGGRSGFAVEMVRNYLKSRVEFPIEPGTYYTVLRTVVKVSGHQYDEPDAVPTVGRTFFGSDNPEELGNPQELILFWALSEAIDGYGWSVEWDREPDVGGPWTGLPWLWKDSPPTIIGSAIDTHLIARVCAVEEDGKKTRIVTTDSEVATTVLHVVRDILYNIIENDPGSTAHNHNTTWHFAKNMRTSDKRKVKIISVDKTRATDTFDLDYTEAIYDGLIEGHNMPAAQSILRCLKPFVTSPRRYLIPSEGETSVSAKNVAHWLKTGEPVGFFVVSPSKNVAVVPMGAPPTYSFLTVWTSMEVDVSVSPLKINDFLSEPYIDRRIPRLIQGDDAIFIGSKRRDKKLRMICQQSGTIIGDGSHFVSGTYGVFCEEPMILSADGTWQHKDLIKVRLLTGVNCRKDPRLPAGKVDPIITRGKAVQTILRYATTDPDGKSGTRTIAVECLDRNTGVLRSLRKSGKKENRFLTLPTFLGGLDYPSNRTDRRQWRKWVPKPLKRVISQLASPNESIQPVITRSLLESTSWVSKHNIEIRVDYLTNLLGDVPLPKQSRDFLKPEMFSKDNEETGIGMVTWNDILDVAQEHPVLSKSLWTDKNGNTPSHPEWWGKRNFRRQIERDTPFLSLSSLLSRIQKDDTLAGLLSNNRKVIPYVSYGGHCRLRKRNFARAVELMGKGVVEKTPIVNFSTFWDLQQRVQNVEQTIWVNSQHPEIRYLLERTGDLRIEP